MSFQVHLGTGKAGFTVGNMVANYLLYADDVCVWSQYQWFSTPSVVLVLLNTKLFQLQQHSRMWRIYA